MCNNKNKDFPGKVTFIFAHKLSPRMFPAYVQRDANPSPEHSIFTHEQRLNAGHPPPFLPNAGNCSQHGYREKQRAAS